MPALPSPLRTCLGAIRAGLRRTDRWLDDPRVEFSVYMTLILMAPLFRLGLDQILHWLTGAGTTD